MRSSTSITFTSESLACGTWTITLGVVTFTVVASPLCVTRPVSLACWNKNDTHVPSLWCWSDKDDA
jgi:uncharacterized membrane protein YccF (DUF307 family)